MSEFYNRLANGNGSRQVKSEDFTVVSSVKKDIPTVTVTTVYLFKGSSQVKKETTNLIERTNSVIELNKIEIVRLTNRKNVSINIRFIGDNDVLMFSETDVNLISMSDTLLLRKLGIEVV